MARGMNPFRVGTHWIPRLLLAALVVGCTSDPAENEGNKSPCPAGYTDCGGQCLDATTNAQNCGACGTACAGGQQCTGGACQCQAGLTPCNGECVNLQGDGANCGSCGTSCPAAQVCAAGACAESCPEGTLQCGSSCVVPESDPLNCGTCGNTCPAPMICSGGACSCPVGTSSCDGQCVDLSSDLNHCGACGTACSGGALCSNGACGGGSGGSGGGPTGGTSGGPTGGTSGGPTGGTGGGESGTGGTGGTLVHPTCPGEASEAYQGTPAAVSGTVEAENFDLTGWSDATTGNEGGAYRTDVDVDIKVLGAGHAVGWMTAGEWLEYTVNVQAAGDYSLTVRAGAVDAGRTLEFSQCGTALTGPVAVPQIAAWGEIASVTASVHLEAGLQVIRVTVGASDFVDFDSFTLQPGGSGTGGTGGTGGTTGGTGGTTGGTGGTTGGTGGATGGSGGKFVGNITTGNNQVDTNGRTYSTYWDQITPENAGKWGSVQGTSSSGFNWGALDSIYDYTQNKGIIFKQHTFLWGAQQPSDEGNITETHVRNWMREFCARYPETRLIDVVNEPPPHTTPDYDDNIGGGTNSSWQWIINAFEWADEYCPNAILILNDYNNIEWGDQTDHFISIANAVKNAGAPIDAIGAQAHGLSTMVSTDTMKTLITRMHDRTGLPVYVTEYDIDLADDQAQLQKFQEHIPFFYETEWIHGITIWGWIHGATWVKDSGIIRNGTPRPAMTWLMDYLERPAP